MDLLENLYNGTVETYFEDATARTDFSRVGNCVVMEGIEVDSEKKTWTNEEPITVQEMNRIEKAIYDLQENQFDAYNTFYVDGRLTIKKKTDTKNSEYNNGRLIIGGGGRR